MFSHEPRVSHIAAAREHIVGLQQSLNQPHLAVPGKQAQASQAFQVGTRNADGSYTVWVFLHLTETEEGVIFLSENRSVRSDQYAAEESDGLAFLESMGFMVDDLRFGERPPTEQDEMIRTLPCFRALSGKKKAGPTRAESLARLLSSF